ncbi:BNR repeat-containing protein [Pseudomonas cerasi]
MSDLKNPQITESVVGECCADFTVDYCLIKQDKFYLAYYNAEHCLTVASRAPHEPHWQISHPKGEWLPDAQRFMHQTDYDSHNYLTLAMDQQGYLHLSGNMHKDRLVYFRSAAPGDIHQLVQQSMTGQREESATYPLFFTDARGELLFRYRDGESGNGDDIYNRWNSSTHCWQRLLEQPLLSGNGLRNAYARLPVAGPDGHWHMIWMWRETPHCETNHSLSYARSPDLINWTRHNGQPLTQPITLESGDLIDGAAPGEGLINMSQNLGFDSKGNVVVTYHRYDAAGNSQAWIARPDGEHWQIRPLSQWHFRWDFKGMGSIPAGVIISEASMVDGELSVSFQREDGSAGRWRINEDDLSVIATEDQPVTALPADYYTCCQNLHPQAEVQLIPELYRQPPMHFLRWEALPVQRDTASGLALNAGTLTVLSLVQHDNKE